jgi:hypothetical protein
MKNIQHTVVFLLLLACLGGNTTLAGVRPLTANTGRDTTDVGLDLIILNAVINQPGCLGFTVTCVADHVSAFDNMHDTLSGQVKIKGQKVYVQLDSTVQVQNDLYNAVIQHKNEVIFLRKKKPVRQSMWQLDLMDKAFVKGYVQRMYKVDSAAFKKIKVDFKPGFPYLAYEMVYDTAQMLPVCVKYKIKREDGTTSGGYDQFHYHFTGFSSASFSDAIFSTDPFFTKENGAWKLTAPYTQYKIADNSSFY